MPVKKVDKNVIITAVITALLGQVYFYPFGTGFRFTIGVIALPFMILYFPRMPVISAALASGGAVLVTRCLLDYIRADLMLSAIFLRHFPGAAYYVLFGLLLWAVNFRRYAGQPVHFLIILAATDVVSNIMELALRQEFGIRSLEFILSRFMLVGIARALITYTLFRTLESYNLFMLQEEHQKRYIDLLLLTAKLKTEIFFLRKSMQDIEQAMQKSYSIYTTLKTYPGDVSPTLWETVKETSLSVAIDIHEIKKVYQRIISGIEKHIPSRDMDNEMKVSEVLTIIKNSTEALITATGKNVAVTANCDTDFVIKEYFPLFSIFNNLIHNALESFAGNRSYHLTITQTIQNGQVVFTVADDGCGISPKDADFIFEPGFTTKFDPATGSMSTGLGLTHVKLLTEHLGGTIHVLSKVNRGTTFTLVFPQANLTGRSE